MSRPHGQAPPTIRDVAREAGVSTAAVSLALNGKPGVSNGTRRRVLEVARRLEYVPNRLAQRLLRRETGNIGLVYSHGGSPLKQLFFLEIVDAALRACDRKGYNLVFSAAPSHPAALPEVVRRRDADGLLVVGEVAPELLELLRASGLPLVLVDDHLRSAELPAVEADYRHGAKLATAYLVSAGHRRIGYIGESARSPYGSLTLAGYRAALEEAGIALSRDYLCCDAREANEESAAPCLARLLALRPPPTALFCAADVYAVGAIREARRQGVHLPEQLSVVGMDDILLARYVEPSLTTVAFPKERMGAAAVEILVECMRSRHGEPEKRLFPAKLVERESVAPPGR